MDPISVLVVDDEKRFRENMVVLLSARGFQVDEAGDGREALDKTAQKRFDVVVLDMKMPGLSGPALLKALRDAGVDAEVLVLTGHASVDDAVELIRFGAADYLLKPCSTDELAAKILTAHERRQVKQG